MLLTMPIDPRQRPPRPEPSEDAVAITRSLADPLAFDALYRRHHRVVHRYVARRIGVAAAEDLVGEVFLAAFASRATFDGARSPSAIPWLLGIATRRISRELEVQRRWLRQCTAARAARRRRKQAPAAPIASTRQRGTRVAVAITLATSTTRNRP